jgi:hypothetical protein
MSHLPHVADYKNKLISLGITCPEQLAKFALEPYATAIIRKHFKFSSSIGLSIDEEQAVWEQLDRWNKISPINGPFVFETVKYRMASLRAALITKGRLPEPFTTVVVVEGTEGVDITQNEEFSVLVEFLLAELVGRHE